MRPPSYYASIVRSNNSSSSSYCPASEYEVGAGPRTSSSQLRSGLSSSSSSSYVSRSHLPFVAQSTLVAHCFTGVGSSTRPYPSSLGGGAASSYSSSYPRPGGSSSSSYRANSVAVSLAAGSRPPSTKRSHLNHTNHHYTASNAQSSARPAAYLRPSHASGPAGSGYSTSSSPFAVSSRPSYRPITSPSYYQPIRLRERPLLSQISSQLGGRGSSRQRASHSIKIKTTSQTPEETAGRPNDNDAQPDGNKENENGDEQDSEDANWSSDVTRNISRNKYLIKFREINKQRPSVAPEAVAAEVAGHLEPSDHVCRRERESAVPDREEPADKREAGEARRDSREELEESEPRLAKSMKILPADKISDEPVRDPCDKEAFQAEPAESTKDLSGDNETGAVEKRRKRPVRGKEEPTTPAADGQENEAKVGAVKKERRRVKLKLKPLAASKQPAATKPDGPLSPKMGPPPPAEPVPPQPAAGQAEPEAAKEVRKREPSGEASARGQAPKVAPVEPARKRDLDSEQPGAGPSAKTAQVGGSLEKTRTSATGVRPLNRGLAGEGGPPNETKMDETKVRKTSAKASATKSIASKKGSKGKLKAKKPIERLAQQGDEQPASRQPSKAEPTVEEKAEGGAKKKRPGQEVAPRTRPAGGRIRCRAYNHDDFNFLTVLGHGGWGFVILAELKGHEACFAVKCIKKITIVEDDDYDSIMIERKVLTLGNLHPFICKLFCTFETEGYLFFVMEYCAGGDLMFHVQREGKFTEPRCRFYAAEIICAIRFLHNRHIIYRDLKLDNILLDARGHIRLVDFGMCQCRTYREEMLPSNFCGTPGEWRRLVASACCVSYGPKVWRPLLNICYLFPRLTSTKMFQNTSHPRSSRVFRTTTRSIGGASACSCMRWP